MSDIEKNPLYSFNRAIEWILKAKSNLTTHEFMQIPEYKIDEALDKLLFAMIHDKLKTYCLNGFNELVIFDVKGSYKIKWDVCSIGYYDDTDDFLPRDFHTVKSLNDLYFFESDLLREFPAPVPERQEEFDPIYLDRFSIIYHENAIYLRVNNKNNFRIKSLNTGDAKLIFEYIYNNPNKIINRDEIAKISGLSKWTKDDRFDQIIRNIFSFSPEILKNCFPVLKTDEVKFIKSFGILSESNLSDVPF